MRRRTSLACLLGAALLTLTFTQPAGAVSIAFEKSP